MRRLFLGLTCFLVACPDRPLGDTEATASSTGDPTGGDPSGPGDPPTGGTAQPTSGDPPDPTAVTATSATITTDSPNPTPGDPSDTVVTTDPVDTTTTDPVDTTTTDPVDTTTTDPRPDMGTPADLPPEPTLWELPAGLEGCVTGAPPGPLVTGTSDFGAFAGKRAFFGNTNTGGSTAGTLNLVILADDADVAAALAEFQQNFGIFDEPAATLNGFWPFDPFWVGADTTAAWVSKGGQISQFPVKLSVEAHTGNWDAFDPADPPRIQGTLSAADPELELVGAFDAVYCDKLDVIVIPE